MKRDDDMNKVFLWWQNFDTISQTVIHLSPHKLSSFFLHVTLDDKLDQNKECKLCGMDGKMI